MMNDSREVTDLVENVLYTSAVATATTTAAVAICGHLEEGQSVAPVNAVSHILWGDDAAAQERASLRYTVPSLSLNGAAISSWAAVHELMFGGPATRQSLGRSLAGGAAVSALAYVTDYYVVPKRFTPGFEKRLSNKSLAVVYGVLAASLGLASWLRQ